MLQPASEGFASAVSIEGSWAPLVNQPLVGESRDVPMVVLAIVELGLSPLCIDPDWISLEKLEGLHAGDRTDGVPLGLVDRVAFVVYRVACLV